MLARDTPCSGHFKHLLALCGQHCRKRRLRVSAKVQVKWSVTCRLVTRVVHRELHHWEELIPVVLHWRHKVAQGVFHHPVDTFRLAVSFWMVRSAHASLDAPTLRQLSPKITCELRAAIGHHVCGPAKDDLPRTDTNRSANCSAEHVVTVGAMRTILVSLSTKHDRRRRGHCGVRGSWTTMSMLTLAQGLSGIGSGCSGPAGLMFPDLMRWQESHFRTKFCTSARSVGHQKMSTDVVDGFVHTDVT